MKILLIFPNQSKETLTYGEGFKIEALGLLSISSYLLQQGHQTHIIDQNLNPLTFTEIIKTYKQFNPEIIGISITYANLNNAISLAKEIKKNQNIPIIVGGCYPTSHPDIIEQQQAFDIAVTGEGETTFNDLILYYSGKKDLETITGISYLKANQLTITQPRTRIQNLDSLPYPDRRFTDPKKLQLRLFFPPTHLSPRPITMVTSRGCGLKCGFCYSPIMWKSQWIGRSPENIMEEIRQLKNHFGINQIFFVDEEINYDRERALKLYRLMKQAKLGIQWATETSVCKTDLELAQAMIDAGLTSLFIGYESGSPEILNKLGKKYDPEFGLRLTKFLQKQGVFVSGNFMLGLPWESKNSLKTTYRFAKKLHLDIPTVTFHRPQPGSSFYTFSVQKKLFSPENYNDVSYNPYKPAAKTLYLTEKEVEKAPLHFLMSVFLDIQYWIRILTRMIKYPMRIPTYTLFYYMIFANGIKSLYKKALRKQPS